MKLLFPEAELAFPFSAGKILPNLFLILIYDEILVGRYGRSINLIGGM